MTDHKVADSQGRTHRDPTLHPTEDEPQQEYREETGFYGLAKQLNSDDPPPNRALDPRTLVQLSGTIGNHRLTNLIQAQRQRPPVTPSPASTNRVQRSFDGFMAFPVPRGRLYQEIADLSLEDVEWILNDLGTPQDRGRLWSEIDGRYSTGTAQRTYDRLIERQNALQGGGGGATEEQAPAGEQAPAPAPAQAPTPTPEPSVEEDAPAEQSAFERFMELPSPRSRLYQEIGNLTQEDIEWILRDLGTADNPGRLWQQIDGRYSGGTAQTVYNRLIERSEALGGGEAQDQQQTADETPAAAPTEEAASQPEAEAAGENVRHVYRNIPCSERTAFIDALRERISRQVMSRTLLPNGDPVRREVSLSENNQSLTDTFDAIQEIHREEIAQGQNVVEDVQADFRVVNNRVESITFIPPQRPEVEEDGPQPEPRRTQTVEFGVFQFTSGELRSQDVAVLTRVSLGFEDQLIDIGNNVHSLRIGTGNISANFYAQVHDHIDVIGPQLPEEDVPMLIETTARVTVGADNEEWRVQIMRMRPQVSIGGTDSFDVGPDPGEIERHQRGQDVLENARNGLMFDVLPDVFGLGPIGAFITAYQMTEALGEFAEENLRQAFGRGWWRVVSTSPVAPANPSDAHSLARSRRGVDPAAEIQNLEREYRVGYRHGLGFRPQFYEQCWLSVLRYRRNRPAPANEAERQRDNAQREYVLRLNRSVNVAERNEFIARCIQERYRDPGSRARLIDYATGRL